MDTSVLTWQERYPDSPFIESVWTCRAPIKTLHTTLADPCISIALIKDNKETRVMLVGPKTRPQHIQLPAGYSCTAIRLKLGAFLKHPPAPRFADNAITLPADAHNRFWLGGKRFQFPNFEQAEQFLQQLHDARKVAYTPPESDPLSTATRPSLRTQTRHMQRTIGLSPYQLFQLQRIHQALRLLKNGVPAVRVASELAFTDQSHLVRATRHFFGFTPKQLAQVPQTPYP